jgi:beta-glucosidase/6-phospho-beta-glucosidase/beta-galactosidase
MVETASAQKTKFCRCKGLVLLAALACGASCRTGSETTVSTVIFPDGFMFGTATAAFQIEKGITASDWSHWVETKGKIVNGDKPDVGGPDALAHVDEDVALMKAMNMNAYRFSIEWSRIYPTRPELEADTPSRPAIDEYARLLSALRAAGIRPMVTLLHFTLPDYFVDVNRPDDPQGWERPEMIDAFAKFCGQMAKRFGDQIDWWATINEPIVPAIGGYIQGKFPPGTTLQVERALAYGKAEAMGHVRCYDAIKANDTIDADGDGKPSMVGPVVHQRAVEPLDKDEPADVDAANRVRYFNNLWFLNVIAKGDFDDDFDGLLTGPRDKTADPALKGRADWIGINYYSRMLASATRGIVIPKLQAAIYIDKLPTEQPKSDFGWDIYPSGLATVLDEVKPYGLPVVITENGIADGNDANRPRFLAEHLFELGLAPRRGVDVRGYFHWSLYDNFEWASGFCPKFGLFAIDPQTKARKPRPSVDLYRTIAGARKVTREQIDRAGPYVTPPAYCQ